MVVIRDKPAVIEAALGLDRVCYYCYKARLQRFHHHCGESVV